jgi:nitrite reductase (cytochrome c-552)
MKKLHVIIASLVVVLVIAVGIFASSQISPPAVQPVAANIPDGELDPAVWGKYFPDQYASYLKNKEIKKGNSKYGGSEPFSHLQEDPMQVKLFAGYGFSLEYNEDRGHVYTLEDVTKIKRVNDKTPSSCLTCKSPSVPVLLQEQGDKFWATPFKENQAKMQHPIACSDCHDNKTMALKITRPMFIEALKAQGKDPDNLSRQEMRSAVCGQCHAEYYFRTDNKKVTFPWANGLRMENMEKYYDDLKFKDWEHPDSKASMLKAQHPDYELFSTGIHAANNVACADCHMPYVKEGKSKISSHQWQSPLNTTSQSCGACHKQSEEYLKNQVIDIQDKVYNTKLQAEKSIVSAVSTIVKVAQNPAVDAKTLEEAKNLHRQAQWRWDFVSAENSMGFHSPTEALRILGEAIDLGHQAEIKALNAGKTQ